MKRKAKSKTKAKRKAVARPRAAAKARVVAVPKGYHTVTPYLSLNNAASAIEFYKNAFGAKEKFRMPGPDNKVMHAELQVGEEMAEAAAKAFPPPSPPSS
ncbi:MAG: VOC family protein [Proteobacteria bacterium]|nr:VOC family protein [Pseudomonadota bacterium]